MFEKDDSCRFVGTALRAHIRTYQPALLKTIIKPTFSKAQQVGEFFTYLSSHRGDQSDQVVDALHAAA